MLFPKSSEWLLNCFGGSTDHFNLKGFRTLLHCISTIWLNQLHYHIGDIRTAPSRPLYNRAIDKGIFIGDSALIHLRSRKSHKEPLVYRSLRYSVNVSPRLRLPCGEILRKKYVSSSLFLDDTYVITKKCCASHHLCDHKEMLCKPVLWHDCEKICCDSHGDIITWTRFPHH